MMEQPQFLQMSSLEEILAKSRELEERHKKFLIQKEQRQRSMKQTDQKAKKALQRLAQTKETIKSIDQLYERFQKSFEEAINSAVQKIGQSRLIQVADENFKPNHQTPQQVANLIKSKKKVVILTGAGVSAASGIPTFRGSNGYWTKKGEQGINPQQFLTLSNFEENQFELWDWLDNFYATKMKCKPNLGHRCIDDICNQINEKKQVCLVTQNIDNYHFESQKRKITKESKKEDYPIYAIHGNILKIRCNKCSEKERTMKFYPYEDYRTKIITKRQRPKCPKCQSFMRPHIMFFDEFYTELYQYSDTILSYLEDTDLCIVIGTALKTGMARNIVTSFITKSLPVVEINIACQIRQPNTIWMEGKSEEFLAEICKHLS